MYPCSLRSSPPVRARRPAPTRPREGARPGEGRRARRLAGGEPLGNLAAKLAVAEPALGRGRNSGGGHREYLREKRGRELLAGARFAMTQVINYRGISPEFLGTPRRYLAFSEAVNAFPPRIHAFPRQFPRIPSLTAAELITVRPRAFPAAPAAFPRLPSPPASLLARLPSPGSTPSRGRAGAGLRARTRGREPDTARIQCHGQETGN